MKPVSSIFSIATVLLWALVSTGRAGADSPRLPGAWTWLAGNPNNTLACDNGVMGTPHPTTQPCQYTGEITNYALWADEENEVFYMFGGLRTGEYSDKMFRFDAKTNLWVWLSGASNAPYSPDYRFFHSSATPGPRSNMFFTSTRSPEGTLLLWLYGGEGDGGHIFGDLWVFDTQLLQWAQWTADQQTRSCPESSDPPMTRGHFGPRKDGAMFWNPLNQSFYLFGGSSGPSSWHDLFILPLATTGPTDEFDCWALPSVNNPDDAGDGYESTWMPPALRGAVTFFDPELQNFYVFGGFAPDYMMVSEFQILHLKTMKWEYLGGYAPSGNNHYTFDPSSRPGLPSLSRSHYYMPHATSYSTFAVTRDRKYAFLATVSTSRTHKHTLPYPPMLWAASSELGDWLGYLNVYNRSTAYGQRGVPSLANTPALRFGGHSLLLKRSLFTVGGASCDWPCTVAVPKGFEVWRYDLECFPGTYMNPAVDFFDCLPCPPGAFAETLNPNFTCTPCPLGTTGNYNGSHNSTTGCQVVCEGREVGVYRDGAAVCEPCPAGTYFTSGICLECGDGLYSNSDATSCLRCAAGQAPSANRSECLPCPSGLVANADTGYVCLPCPSGYYALSNGSACIPCSIGSSSSGGSTNCTACPSGQTSDASTQHLCIPSISATPQASPVVPPISPLAPTPTDGSPEASANEIAQTREELSQSLLTSWILNGVIAFIALVSLTVVVVLLVRMRRSSGNQRGRHPSL